MIRIAETNNTHWIGDKVMSIKKTVLIPTVTIVALVIVAGAVQAREPKAAWLFDWRLEPVELPKSPGAVPMRLEFSPGELCRLLDCTEAEISVTTIGGLEYLGPQNWKQRVKFGETYSEVIHVNIPPNDTCGLIVSIGEQRGGVSRAVAYFVTFRDSVEFWKGNPRGAPRRNVMSRPDSLRALFTPEQLAQVVTIRFSLRGELKSVLARVNELVDELLPTDEDSVFTARVTKDVLFSLRDIGISCYVTEQPAPPQPDSASPPPKRPDSSGQQGWLDNQRKTRGSGVVWLDSVGELTSTGKLPVDETVKFYLGMLNNTGYNQKGISNGFRIYSPNGATWTGIVGDTLSSLNWDYYFDLIFGIQYFSNNGSGADTVGFSGSHLFHGGLPTWFNDTAYTITIGPIPSNHTGKTICLDSSFFPPAGTWKWNAGAGLDFFPSWGGPCCYTVGEPPITFQGYLFYLDPTPKSYGIDTTEEPMRYIKIQMWDQDPIPYAPELLASTWAEGDGWFEFNNVSNNDEYDTGTQDVYFVITARNHKVKVLKDVQLHEHTWTTPVADDLPGGTYDTLMTASVDQSRPFFVADVIVDVHETWDDLRPPYQYPLWFGQVLLAADTIESLYDETNDLIFINDSIDASNQWPDTWCRSVICHEFGHRISHTWNFCDDHSNYPGSHYAWEAYNQETAAMEGFSHWWSAVANGSSVRVNYWSNFADSLWIDFESGEFGEAYAFGSLNAMGPECEGAVAGIWWDIFDNTNDDYSGESDFGLTRLPHHPDNIKDTLWMGHERIMAVLLDDEHLGHRPDNIDEFWAIWFGPKWHRHEQAMKDIWYEHGDGTKSGCCVGIRGNIDGDPEERVDIADLVFLVDYMFLSGPEPGCGPETNINGLDGDVLPDISDLVFLLDYMYLDGPEPPSCP